MADPFRLWSVEVKASPVSLIIGAGDAALYDPQQSDDPSSWLEFTAKFNFKMHSFAVAEVDGRTREIPRDFGGRRCT